MKKLLIFCTLVCLLFTACGETSMAGVTVVVPDGMPAPVNPEDAVIDDEAYTCTLSIICPELVGASELDKNKAELVPADGMILAETEVTFYGGESVFNLLRRECRQRKIHLEFTETPLYNSAYIEGIGNLYEFDAGALSGWVYTVNDWSPNYGSSRYALCPGDVVVWEFTLDGQGKNGFAAEEIE